MSSRFTETVQEKQCRSCGEPVKTDDKLLEQCRECYLDKHGDLGR